MDTVLVLALPGSLRSSVAITLDVLETANRVSEASGDGTVFDVQCVEEARSANGSVGSAGLVVVPGLGYTKKAEIVTGLGAPEARAAADVLRAAADRGASIAGGCSGVFLLASAGLLDSRRATTSWWLAPTLRELHPDVDLVVDALVVEDGPITTAGAAMAQLDLLIHMVSRSNGPDLANRCARYLSASHRTSQSQFIELGTLARGDEDVARAREWALKHLDAGLTVEDLARSVRLGERTFARRVRRATGLSPVRFLRRVRVERASQLLTDTTLSVEAIAHAVGYADATALRRATRIELGCSPRDLRRER